MLWLADLTFGIKARTVTQSMQYRCMCLICDGYLNDDPMRSIDTAIRVPGWSVTDVAEVPGGSASAPGLPANWAYSIGLVNHGLPELVMCHHDVGLPAGGPGAEGQTPRSHGRSRRAQTIAAGELDAPTVAGKVRVTSHAIASEITEPQRAATSPPAR